MIWFGLFFFKIGMVFVVVVVFLVSVCMGVVIGEIVIFVMIVG